MTFELPIKVVMIAIIACRVRRFDYLGGKYGAAEDAGCTAFIRSAAKTPAGKPVDKEAA